MDPKTKKVTRTIGAGLIILGVLGTLLGVPMWGIPQYNIYKKAMKGRSALAEAEWSRQIMVAEAKAKLEAAELNRQAAVEDARGVADSVAVIGDSLTKNPEYLKYLWITKMDTNGERVYIPTDRDGFPKYLEAGASVQPRMAPFKPEAGQ